MSNVVYFFYTPTKRDVVSEKLGCYQEVCTIDYYDYTDHTKLYYGKP